MKKICALLALALVWAQAAALAAGGAEEIQLGPFSVSCPEGWTLAHETGLSDGSLEYGNMDAYVYMSVTDLTGEASVLPALTAAGAEYTLRLFAGSALSCDPEDFLYTEADGCPAVRIDCRVRGVDAACAAVLRDRQALLLVGSDIGAGLGRDAVLDLALSCVRARERGAEPSRAEYLCGAFRLPCPPDAEWERLDGETGCLIYDDGLTTVSAQYEILEGTDVSEMVEAAGADYYMESAEKYFGGKGIVRGGEIVTTPGDILALRMDLDAEALIRSILGSGADGLDLSACTAQGLLLMEGECTATLIAVSASPDRAARAVADRLLKSAVAAAR